MILSSLVEKLHCPYCGSRFDVELRIPSTGDGVEYGIIKCACYRYPILYGIPVLRQGGPREKGTFGAAIDHLVRGEPEKAVSCALAHVGRAGRQGLLRTLTRLRLPLAGAWQEHQFERANWRVHSGLSLGFEEALKHLRIGSYADYLFYRYANPSFIAAVPQLQLLEMLCQDSARSLGSVTDGSNSGTERKVSLLSLEIGAPRAAVCKRRILDLGCGIGHASAQISETIPGTSIIAADSDFTNLYLARRYVIPDECCLCVDAEVPLPFPDDFFDAVVCLDAFHYFRSKIALLRELDRVLQQHGLWLFLHLHNALQENYAAGSPLSPKDYLRCFDFVEPRLFAERSILDQFMQQQSLDLETVPTESDLENCNALCLLAGAGGGLWQEYDNIAVRCFRSRSHLGINPIYRVDTLGDVLQLEIEWPSQSLEQECASVKDHLPSRCEVGRALLKRLSRGVTTKEDEPVIQALRSSFVLVSLPPGYSRQTVMQTESSGVTAPA